jgi:CrcB protein
MNNFVLFCLGGGLGSGLRGLICQVSNLGVIIVNLLGCFLIGLVVAKFSHYPAVRASVITGFLGGLTTFSSFGLEALQIFKSKGLLSSLIYISIQLILGLFLVWLGMRCAS